MQSPFIGFLPALTLVANDNRAPSLRAAIAAPAIDLAIAAARRVLARHLQSGRAVAVAVPGFVLIEGGR